MRSFLNRLTLVAILIGLSNNTLVSQEVNPSKRELRIELSTDAIRDSSFFPEVTHVAEFYVLQDRKITATWLSTIENTPQWLIVSEAQRKLILKIKRHTDLSLLGRSLARVGKAYRSSKTPQGTVGYQIWGGSQEDAKITAVAFIEQLDRIAAQKHEVAKQGIEHLQSALLEADKTIPGLESDCEQLMQKRSKSTKTYAQKYALVDDTLVSVLKHAVSAHEDASVHLREIKIELLGLDAKQEAIRSFKRKGTIQDKATLLKLDQLLVVNEIDQFGALARKSAYTEIFTQTQQVLQADRATTRAYSDLSYRTTKQKEAKDQLEKLEREITNAPGNGNPVSVHDNLIRIRPVRH